MKIIRSSKIEQGKIYHALFTIPCKDGSIQKYNTAYSIRNEESRVKAVLNRCKVKAASVVNISTIKELGTWV